MTLRFPSRCWRPLPCALLLTTAPAFSQSATPPLGLHPSFEVTYGHDDNLLRAADRQADGRLRLADTYRRLGGGLEFGARVSNQVLGARVNVYRTSFRRLDWLDYDSGDVQGLWRGQFGDDVESNLGVSKLRTLAPYGEYRGSERNIRTVRRGFLDLAWRMASRWRVRAGVSADQLRYALPSLLSAERNEHTVLTGADYLAPSGSILGVQAQRLSGRYVHGLGGAQPYRQDSVEGNADWRLTAHTRVHASAGWARRRHEEDAARDFSGGVARLTLTLEPSGKTALLASTWRELSPTSDVDAAYAVTRGISLTPVWTLTGKVRLGALARRETLSFAAGALDAGATRLREDKVNYGALTLDYAVRLHWTLNVAAYRDVRRSSLPELTFRARGVTINAAYRF
jgi:exopolysaccharide biosynthesis operon protein EpsL